MTRYCSLAEDGRDDALAKASVQRVLSTVASVMPSRPAVSRSIAM